MEWDRYICRSRRCAGQSRRWLAVVACVQLTVDNSSSFLAADSRQLAEGHSPALARLRGTVFLNTSKDELLVLDSFKRSLKCFLFAICTDTAHREINILMIARYISVQLIMMMMMMMIVRQCLLQISVQYFSPVTIAYAIFISIYT